MVGGRAAPRDLDERNQDSEDKAPEQGDSHEQKRIRERALQNIEDRPVMRERPSEFAVRQLLQVAGELHWQRLVEAILCAKSCAYCFTDVWIIQDRAERITRREVDQRKADRRNEGDDYRCLCEP